MSVGACRRRDGAGRALLDVQRDKLRGELAAGAGARSIDQFKNSIADKDPGAFCASLTSHASRQFISAVPKKEHATSCKAAAADLFKVAGGPSVAKVRLLTVRVNGNTATTTDTAGPPAAQWVPAPGASTWKIASLPSNL